jgi:hypothetical protein
VKRGEPWPTPPRSWRAPPRARTASELLRGSRQPLLVIRLGYGRAFREEPDPAEHGDGQSDPGDGERAIHGGSSWRDPFQCWKAVSGSSSPRRSRALATAASSSRSSTSSAACRASSSCLVGWSSMMGATRAGGCRAPLGGATGATAPRTRSPRAGCARTSRVARVDRRLDRGKRWTRKLSPLPGWRAGTVLPARSRDVVRSRCGLALPERRASNRGLTHADFQRTPAGQPVHARRH